MPECITVTWQAVALVLAVTAPRLVAEFRNGWHSTGVSTDSEADSGS